LQGLSVGVAPNAGEDLEACLGEVDRSRGADAGRCSGDDNRAAPAGSSMP